MPHDPDTPTASTTGRRDGLPAEASVVDEATLVAPSGTSYRIIVTTEQDPDDAPAPALALNDRLVGVAALDRDTFTGKARRAAKLSIANAPVTAFDDVDQLIATFPSDASMRNRRREVQTKTTSTHVLEERRNVLVRAFLYAASFEDDRDYHLIIGRAPGADPPVYLTVEVSGLPAETSVSFARLKAARDTYKAFFGSKLPGTTYDFYSPPIPVEIEGSPFWDASHAHGTRPGPQSLRPDMPVVWEIHPITRIVFEP